MEYQWYQGRYVNFLNQYNSGVMSLFGNKPAAQQRTGEATQQQQGRGA